MYHMIYGESKSTSFTALFEFYYRLYGDTHIIRIIVEANVHQNKTLSFKNYKSELMNFSCPEI